MRSLSNHFSSADYSTDVASNKWEVVRDDNTFKSLFYSKSFKPSGGNGYSEIIEDTTTAGYSIKHTDTDSTNIASFNMDFKEVFTSGDSYQMRVIFGKKTSAQTSLLRLTDGGGNTGEIRINLLTGVLVYSNGIGNISLTSTSKELTRGIDGAWQVDMIMTMTGAVGTAFGSISYGPVYNLDGSTISDGTAIGDAEILDIQIGAASEFIDEGIETVRVDASGGAIALTLDAASGTGNTFLYSLVDKTNQATVTVQAGEAVNGTTDGTFYLSNFDVGTTFMVVDRAAGNWDISVVGVNTNGESAVSLVDLTDFTLATGSIVETTGAPGDGNVGLFNDGSCTIMRIGTQAIITLKTTIDTDLGDLTLGTSLVPVGGKILIKESYLKQDKLQDGMVMVVQWHKEVYFIKNNKL